MLRRLVLPTFQQKRGFHDCPTNAIQSLRLLLIGCPGSGKGTQSKRLQTHFGVSHFSSGDILRKHIREKTVLGQQASQYVSQGRLVPDHLLISLIDNELLQLSHTVSYSEFKE